MKTIDIAEHTGEYASKWGLTDFYPEAEAELKKALESGEDFETDWFGCKKEIRYAKITGDQEKITIEVSAHMDDLWEEDDLIYDALWEVSKIEDELPEEVIDSILEVASDAGISDSTTYSTKLPRSATFEQIVKATRDLESSTEANNHTMYLELCDIVKAHVDYMNTEVSE